MRTVCCRICGAFHKKRTIDTKIVFCGKCYELVCAVHTQTVQREGFERKVVEKLYCKVCLAEEVLTV